MSHDRFRELQNIDIDIFACCLVLYPRLYYSPGMHTSKRVAANGAEEAAKLIFNAPQRMDEAEQEEEEADEAEKKRRPFSSLRNDPLKMRFGKYLPSFCDKSLLFTKRSVTLVVVLVNWLHVVPGPGQEGGCNSQQLPCHSIDIRFAMASW